MTDTELQHIINTTKPTNDDKIAFIKSLLPNMDREQLIILVCTMLDEVKSLEKYTIIKR